MFFFDQPPSVPAKWAPSPLSALSLSASLASDLAFTTFLTIATSDERNALLCRATIASEEQSHPLLVPQSWIAAYPHVFQLNLSAELILKPATLPILTAVIVVALSDDAYIQAKGDPSLVEKAFADEEISREGDIISLPSSGPIPLQYRLELLEPVPQGCIQPGTTNVLLLSYSVYPACDAETVKVDDDQDAIEINEGFLGSTVLNPTFRQPHLQQNANGYSTSPPQSLYISKTLSTLISSLEDHYTLYLRVADLGRIGIQSGDWAIASGKSSLLRLVRVVAKDDLLESTGSMAGSPLLLRNMFGDESDELINKHPLVHIRPSPFGSLDPPIPTARSITIARVASPISINRQYERLFLDSLKAYFDSGKRLMKQGDLFAVSLDTDQSRWFSDEPRTEEPSSNSRQAYTPSSNPTCSPRSNAVVYFKVTNIEYDVVATSSSSTEDLYTGSTLGELGCWIDASVTRMVQAGVEQSRIPDTGTYMHIDQARLFTQLKAQPSSRLLGPKSPYAKLLALTSAALSRRALDYNLDLSFLLKGGRGIGKFCVTSWVAAKLGLHLFEVDCYDILGENDTKTEALLRVRFEQAASCSPCLLVLRHLEALSQTTQALEPSKESTIVNAMRDLLDGLQSSWKIAGYPVVVVGTTSESSRVHAGLLSCFKQEILFEAPNEGERLEILRCLLSEHDVASDVSVQNVAAQTAALLAGDLRDLIARAKTASIERACKANVVEGHSHLVNVPLSAADFEVALGKARESYSESIGAPKIPSVSWDDVGGLAHVKNDILDTIQLPLEHPELFADGLKKRSGILLYGPPGTGKTLIAKAVATSCSLNFFSVKGPELLNMYIGESEANVRRVFQRARDAKPCVIFFDELDSVAPKRGNHGDSGGVMDRIVSQLLAELDGMSGGKEGADVFVIGATNRPDLLDPALLRPGRFDRMLYLGVSDTHEAQLNILEALTRKFRLDPTLNLRNVAERCPFNYTGADFYALCSDAMLNAMSRKAEMIEEKIGILNTQRAHGHPHPVTPQYYLAELASPEDMTVYVSEEDFDRALKALVPSVSQAEMEHYAQVQQRFSQKKSEEER
ncbi:unnamed protein product [Cyclocybe aegerita]|uniref:Peroxisomal ATPase PEX6 n=1 Tax=Cyclocybe aegerita TaxID=1973307 RepID=A0A8S0X851_CYCAE|nr:unnamed protein product [Cyclocybe aegerita]